MASDQLKRIPATRSRFYRIYCLFILAVVHLNAQWQQYCKFSLLKLTLLFYDIVWVYVREKNGDAKTNFMIDMNINEKQYALMTGFFFTYTNVCASIYLGHQVDNFNRKYVLVCCCFLWNLTCCMGYFI